MKKAITINMSNVLLLAVTLFVLIINVLQGFSQTPCIKHPRETYFLNTGRSASGAVSWGEDKLEVQGLAHEVIAGKLYWIIIAVQHTSRFSGKIKNAYIFKIPATEDLQKIDVFNNPHVQYKSLANYKALWHPDITKPAKWRMEKGYNHWGDGDVYTDKNGKQYLIIPMTKSNDKPIVAIFRAKDFSLAGYGYLIGPNNKNQTYAGWCCINPKTGMLFSSENNTNSLIKNSIPWQTMPSSGSLGEFPITYITNETLMASKTTKLHKLWNFQGGCFSEHGDILYISNGAGKCKGFPSSGTGGQAGDGIHAFDTVAWKEIKHSYNRMYVKPGESNCCYPYKDYFDFTYDFSCGFFEVHSEQPEGIDIVDLNKYKHHKNITGQLHVLGASVGILGNQAWIDNYTNLIYLDKIKGEPAAWPSNTLGGYFADHRFSGTKAKPFKTLGEAINFYPAWEGAQIVFNTPQNSKPSVLTIQGGLVGYLVMNVPYVTYQLQPFSVELFLTNYTSKNISKNVTVNFYLCLNPINPKFNPSAFIKIGSFNHFVQINAHSAKSYVVNGLNSPVAGAYYLGTNINCGPISSPANPHKIGFLQSPYSGGIFLQIPDSETQVNNTPINIEGTSYDYELAKDIFVDSNLTTLTTNITETFGHIQNEDDQVVSEDNEIQRINPLTTEVSSNEDLEIYPNPASDKINLVFYGVAETNYSVRLIDASGHSILIKQGTTIVGNNLIEIDVGNLKRGLYFLNIITGFSSRSEKIILQ